MLKEAAVNIGLLKTKYNMPVINKQMLSQHTLNHKLEDSLSHKLTIISAPAGYGKTTAVLKWIENISLPCCWLSIDSDDNDAIVFWRYTCAALDSISGSLSKDLEYVFQSQELLKANIHLSILIDKLSNVKTDFLLILDDVHLITNPEILDGLYHFITYLPSNMHLILITRGDSRLKLAKLALKEDLIKITAEDLRFDTEEISQYFKARGCFLQKEDIQKVESYTEGWAAALVAVALSLKDGKYRHNVISSFGSSNLHIENYLAEDVFNTWSTEQQGFMKKTSILDRLCGPLCEAVTGSDGSRLLKELYNQNSFLIALDNGGTWFRYHHLFSDFLRNKLEKEDSAIIKNLHHNAGEWLKANGFYCEAIEHFLKGEHYEEALYLIEKQGRVLVRRGEYSNVISWIERLPGEYIQKSPIIMLIKANYFAEINDFKKAWKCIQNVELSMKDSKEVLKTEYMMSKANLFLRQGDIKNLLSSINEAAACGVSINLNKDYMYFNLYEISSYRAATCTFIKALKHNPNMYYSIVKSYRSLISKGLGYAPLIEGEFYYESGKLSEALPKLTVSVDEAINAHCLGALVPAMVTIAKIRRAYGDISGAIKILEECEKRVEQSDKPHWSYILKAFKVRLYIDMGNTEMLDKWLAESRLSLFHDIVPAREYEFIVLARVLIEKHRYDDASILLNRLLIFAQQFKRTHSTVEIINLLAITAMKNLNEEAALEYFEKALLIGIEEGYVRSFTDELHPIVTLLEIYIKKHPGKNRLGTYAKDLLNFTKDGIKNYMTQISTNTLENLLTSVEKKILLLIIKAYTNKEISNELGITLRTVKAHTGSIYKKLGVKSRSQCITSVLKIINKSVHDA